jgi:hypothetical protein
MDNKEIGQQAILDFASLRKKKVEIETIIEEEKPIVVKKKVDYDTQAQIMSARVHANNEIKQFKESVDEFANKIDELCMFKGLGDILKSICVHEILESSIDPILKGRKPPYMPDEMFLSLRADLYKRLINKYVLNNDINE